MFEDKSKMFEVELTPEYPLSDIVDLSKTVEKEGFCGVWVTDHYNNRNSIVVLSAIAEATKKVGLGPGVTNPYYTHPAWMASAISTLDELSEKRARLGIGAGDINTLSSIGINRENPLEKVKKAVKTIRELLGKNKLNYDTRSIPIYIGGQGPMMLDMASDIADGILINASHSKDFKWSIDQIGDTDADIIAYTSFSIDKKRSLARKESRKTAAFVAAGATEKTLDRHKIDKKIASDIGEKIKQSEFREAFSMVTENMIDSFSISGSPEDCKEKIDKILDVGVDKIVIGSPIGPNPQKSLKLASKTLNI